MARLSITSLCLSVLELIVATTAIVIFGLAYPDRFRTRLWENGGEEGWNSNPNKRIYFYANHKEPPKIPLIWSQRLTDSNLAIAILSLVVFVSRTAMMHLNYLPRYANVLYDIFLVCLWIYSIEGQRSGDLSVPETASTHPWYLERSCSDSWPRNRGYCHVAQASFGFSILAAALYSGKLLRELLLVAYQRGKHSGQGWTAVSTNDERDEEKYSDVEDDEASTTLPEVQASYDAGLSPVLAFFPATPNRLG